MPARAGALRFYAEAGADRVMLMQALHEGLDQIRLNGERLAPCSPIAPGVVERRGEDLNLRSACTDNGFRDRRIRPLCHPSAGARDRGVALTEKEGFEPSMEPFSPITP